MLAAATAIAGPSAPSFEHTLPGIDISSEMVSVARATRHCVHRFLRIHFSSISRQRRWTLF
jgi:hypothetical protein